MTKEFWYNLWRSYRVFKRESSHVEALLAIAHFNKEDALLLHRLTK